MHAVIRSYSGSGAKELFELMETRKDEVESVIGVVTGFVSYTAVQTDDGGISVTICQDKAGTDESGKTPPIWTRPRRASRKAR
jgi:hypothetical protein